MPTNLPSARDAHVNAVLTDIAIAYGQDLSKKSVAAQAATVMRVEKQSDKYFVWNKGDMFRSEMQKRADGAESAGGGQRLSTDEYFAEVYALHTYLSDRQRKNSDVDLEKAKIRYLMHQAFLKRDKVWASALFKTGIWTGNTEQTGKSSNPSTNEFLQWNDSTSDPIEKITTQILAMEVTSGLKPNVAVTNAKVVNALKNHGDFLDRIKHTQVGVVTEQLIAQVLGLDRLIVGEAIENTGKEGQSASMSRVFGNHFLLLYVNNTPSPDMPSSNYLFSWSEFDKVTAEGASIASWYNQDRKATKYEAEQAFAVKQTAADLGVMMLDAVA